MDYRKAINVCARLSFRLLAHSALLVALVAAFNSRVLADNGALAYSYPVSGIDVNGDASDWDESGRWYPISLYSGAELTTADDFSARFRIGHNLSENALYVIMEVTDETAIYETSDGGAWDAADAHLLYIDTRHDKAGSGSVLYQAIGKKLKVSAADKFYDPHNFRASSKDAQISVARNNNVTTYEWRVAVQGTLAENTTIGIDHLLLDRDNADADTSYGLWGSGFGKSTNTGRLGDVVLLDSSAALTELSGRLLNANGEPESGLNRVRIASVNNPRLWIHAPVAEDGGYSLKLPAGEYQVSYPYTVSDPFTSDFDVFPQRITTNIVPSVELTAGEPVTAENLIATVHLPPDYLFEGEGILFDYSPADEARLDNFLQTYKAYYQVPGVSVALVKDGEVVYHRTLGERDHRTGAPVVEKTRFEAASITKPVFAFAVMALAERGIIDLDKPLYEYLPFDHIAADPRSRKITARLVLSHQSGLPNWVWAGAHGWQSGGPSELLFEPGNKFGYSGEAFDYLGRVVEKITNKPVEQVVEEQVMQPLDMTNSFLVNADKNFALASLGHMHTYSEFFSNVSDKPSPASSMHTEAKDFAKFMIGVMERKVLNQKSYQEMLKPYRLIPSQERVYDRNMTQHISLGFFLQQLPQGLLIQHGGNNGDFHCKFGVIPERGVGYVIFSNNNISDKLNRAFELFLLKGVAPSRTPAVSEVE